MNAPCATCPWRRSSTPGGGDIPGFDLDLMRKLSNTVGEGDGLRHVMACRYSPCGEETACIGYAYVEGFTNITVRLMVLRGELDMDAIAKACDDLDLYGSFDEMLKAYEAAS